MNNDQEPTVVEENLPAKTPVTSKFERVKPILKKALVWGGAAIGVIAGAVLLSRLQPEDEDEIEYIVIEESSPTTSTDPTID